jgi:hypothetical protein
LHFQLDLVDLQFVEQAPAVSFGSGRGRFRVLLPEALLGTTAQLGGRE